MDVPFDYSAYQPTGPARYLATLAPDQHEKYITTVIERLCIATKIIQRHPYHPLNWNQRGDLLADLNYPELAIGDYWKAEVLVRETMNKLNDAIKALERKEDRRTTWMLGYESGFWMLQPEQQQSSGEQSFSIESHVRAQLSTAYCHFYMIRDKQRRISQDSRLNGTYKVIYRPYPWLSSRHAHRSDHLVDATNHELANKAISDDEGRVPCEVRRHALPDTFSSKPSSDILGVFASQDIAPGQEILTDVTRVWGRRETTSASNTHDVAGSPSNASNFENEYVLEPDRQVLRDNCPEDEAGAMLFCRLLLTIIQDGSQHPLDHPFVERLTSAYHKSYQSDFSREADIAQPNLTLQRAGIDIFADAGGVWDTWVLGTILARVANNRCSSPISSSLFPFFSLFNHSCEPNADWSMRDKPTEVCVVARKAIKRGEQIFIQYDGYATQQPIVDRWAALKPWLDGPCRCKRCLREEAYHGPVEMAIMWNEYCCKQNSPGWDG